jgi:hypothetical protein
MPEAHRRLMAQLPADSPYRVTEEETLTSGIRALWRRAAAVGQPSAAQPPIQNAA